MKSNEIKLSNSLSCAVEALQMVEATAGAAGLDRGCAGLYSYGLPQF